MPVPDVSNVITEDDTPVDNLFSEKQMRMLTESLHNSWEPGFPFVAMANVGLYVALNRPVVVPDVLVTTQVTTPEDILQKGHRSYFTWIYDGKVPEIVVEIVSNKKGGELTSKMVNYEQIGVKWYAVFDPFHYIQDEGVQYFTLKENRYEKIDRLHTAFGLGLTLWDGHYEGAPGPWLRWVGADGELIPTGKEKADAAVSKAEAEAARSKALAQKLRELGIDPDSVS